MNPESELHGSGKRGRRLRKQSGLLLKRLSLAVLVMLPLVSGGGSTASAADQAYVSQWGDSLASVAATHNVSVEDLAAVNNLLPNDPIWAGQPLVIPDSGGAASAAAASAALDSDSAGAAPAGTAGAQASASGTQTYVVQRGDTLAKVAARFGTTAQALAALNKLHNTNLIYVGQVLKVRGTAVPAQNATQQSNSGTSGSVKWIDVNLTRQRLTAYEGNKVVLSVLVSTGKPATPTVVGRFKVLRKLATRNMSGPGYYLPNVPYVMYFYQGYAMHGTYWHTNFGHPMSHGCVNLATANAKWLYSWAPIGTLVVTHY